MAAVPALAHWYSFRWEWTGNVGVDLLIRPFAASLRGGAGRRVIAGLIPPLTGLAMLAVEHSLRGRITPASFLAFRLHLVADDAASGCSISRWGWRWRCWPLRCGCGWTAGSTALARARCSCRSGWWCGCAMLSAWGVLGCWCSAMNGAGTGPALRRSSDALAAAVAGGADAAGADRQGGGTTAAFSYGRYRVDLQGRDLGPGDARQRRTAIDAGSLGLGRAAGAGGDGVPALRLCGSGAAALIMLALSLVLPRHISGGDFVDFRMMSTGTDGQLPGDRLALARCWLVGRTAALCWASGDHHNELAHGFGPDRAIAPRARPAPPRGQRRQRGAGARREEWRLDHFEHIGCYAVLRRDAMVNANFAVPHVHMLHLRQGGFADPSHRMRQAMRCPVDLARFRSQPEAPIICGTSARNCPPACPPGAVVWCGRPAPAVNTACWHGLPNPRGPIKRLGSFRHRRPSAPSGSDRDGEEPMPAQN